VRDFLAETLRRKNIEVLTAENGQKAIALLKEIAFDVVITDMKMPDITGLDVIRKVKELSPNTVVVVITAFGSIENAVEAMRLGAFNYLIKPFSPDTIEVVIEKINEHLSLLEENQYMRRQLSPCSTSSGIQQIIGESPAMKQILHDVEKVAKSQASVFIHGESGTGKEVIAQAIHFKSPRAQKPFIKVNCAAVPETLVESEFFGHEKGAFTGANARRLGRFELAHGGTLLLDEITEIPLMLQAKLLRAIQEQEFERVGGVKPVKVDVRLISTSNRDIKEAIAQKFLREDLYYRLNVVPISIPPLRERPEDIIPLAEYFLEKSARENHKERKTLSPEAKKILLNYCWPGNIREMANIIERAVVMEHHAQITPEHLYLKTTNEVTSLPSSGKTLQELEKQHIIEVLQSQKNNRTKAAKMLGISMRTLRDKIQAYDLDV
jgi:two-component system response regulator AtoC